MIKSAAKLSPWDNSLGVTIPKDILEAAGLHQGDEVTILARDDGVIEISHVAPAEAGLDAGFKWSLGRFGLTYKNLST